MYIHLFNIPWGEPDCLTSVIHSIECVGDITSVLVIKVMTKYFCGDKVWLLCCNVLWLEDSFFYNFISTGWFSHWKHSAAEAMFSSNSSLRNNWRKHSTI